jgi:hypothetical protein
MLYAAYRVQLAYNSVSSAMTQTAAPTSQETCCVPVSVNLLHNTKTHLQWILDLRTQFVREGWS